MHPPTLLRFGMIVILTGVCAICSQAATFLVANANDSGPGSLRQAIIVANTNGENDTITFDPIVFSVPQTINLSSGELVVENDFGSGSNHTLTIIGPGSDLLTIDTNHTSRILNVRSGNGPFTLKYLTLRRGYALRGGALELRQFANLEGLVIRESIAEGYGFEFGNPSAGAGGGVYAFDALRALNCSFIDNVAKGVVVPNTNPNSTIGDFGGPGVGGAMFLWNFNVEIIGCYFIGNRAEGKASPPPPIGRLGAPGGNGAGGSIYTSICPKVINSQFTSNAAVGGTGSSASSTLSGVGGSAEGGAIWCSDLKALNSTFEGNFAIAGDGGVSNNPTASGNGGDAIGGAIIDRGSSSTIANLTFVNNFIKGGNGRNGGNVSGGALRYLLSNQHVFLFNLTVTDNTCLPGTGFQANGTGQGGGIYSSFAPDSDFAGTFRNNIVAENTCNSGRDIFGSFSRASNNLIGDGTGSTGFSNGVNGNLVGTSVSPIDPLLAPIADNQGVTRTRAPLPGSPVVDNGTNQVFNTWFFYPNWPLLVFDQRNRNRISPIGGTIDMGAFESQSDGILKTSSPDLRAATDSGNDSDNITNSRSPILDLTETIPGATIELRRDGAVVATVTAVAFTTSLIDIDPPLNGSVIYNARQIIGGVAAPESPALTVNFDNTPPTGTINQAATQADPTRLLPINFTAVFSEPIDTFARSFVGSTATVSSSSGTTQDRITWNVAVEFASANGGTVVVSLATLRDIAGNMGTALPSTDNTVFLDNVRPTVTVNQAPGQPDPTSVQPIRFRATFSESVSGFVPLDVSLAGSTANVSGALIELSDLGGNVFDIQVSNIQSGGNIRVTVPANAVEDNLGNLNQSSTSSDNTVTLTLGANGIEGDIAPRQGGDGAVLSTDVVQLRRYVTGLDVPNTNPNEFQRADCAPRSTFGDGAVTSTDVVQARRYVSGLDPVTSTGGPTAPASRPIPKFQKEAIRGWMFQPQDHSRVVANGVGSYFIEIARTENVAGAIIRLSYDPALGRPAVALTEQVKNEAVLTVNDSVKGEIVVLVDSVGPLVDSGKTSRLVEISFDEGTRGDANSLSLVSPISLSDEFGNDLATDWFPKRHTNIGSYPGSFWPVPEETTCFAWAISKLVRYKN